MNNPTNPQPRPRQAFTLIELLIVIAVIAVLAAMIIPVTGVLARKRKIAVAQAELIQIETFINLYKEKKGGFPPDNPQLGDPDHTFKTPLYYELAGAVVNDSGQIYTNLDLTTHITKDNYRAAFNQEGIMNSGRSARGSDEAEGPVNFLKSLKSAQIGELPLPENPKVLVCTVRWDTTPERVAGTQLNPWNYVSSNPTNNDTFDLWVDVPVGGKVYRISNWSRQPQQL